MTHSLPLTTFVALLRAVNVGGTGKLPMSDLKAMCEKLGFTKVQTCIASGNVLFESRKSQASVRRPCQTDWVGGAPLPRTGGAPKRTEGSLRSGAGIVDRAESCMARNILMARLQVQPSQLIDRAYVDLLAAKKK